MTEKPTGVFVRLPIPEVAARKIRGALNTPSYEPERLYTALITIGTPVQGAELETLGYVPEGPLWNGSQFGLRNLYRTTEAEVWPRAVTGLVEAQALLASRDAEIVRLRGHIERIDKLIMGNSDPVIIFCGIHANCTEALKGGAV